MHVCRLRIRLNFFAFASRLFSERLPRSIFPRVAARHSRIGFYVKWLEKAAHELVVDDSLRCSLQKRVLLSRQGSESFFRRSCPSSSVRRRRSEAFVVDLREPFLEPFVRSQSGGRLNVRFPLQTLFIRRVSTDLQPFRTWTIAFLLFLVAGTYAAPNFTLIFFADDLERTRARDVMTSFGLAHVSQ